MTCTRPSAARRSALVAAALCAAAFNAAAHDTSVPLVCVMSGLQQVPDNASGAWGAGRAVADLTNNSVKYRFVVGGLGGAETGAEICGPADPGASAPAVFTLPPGAVKTGTWTYPQSIEADLRAGKYYVSIRSSTFPGGEIRGQLVDLVADLSGDQAVPPSATGARGVGLFFVDHPTNSVRYYIKHTGAGETGAAIRGFTNFGLAAPTVLAPLPLGTVKTGVWTYADVDELKVFGGLAAVEIALASGSQAVRGQIVSAVDVMDHLQMVPPGATPVTGVAYAALDRDLNQLGYFLARYQLTSAETAAQVRGYTPPGINGSLKFTIPPATPRLGVWSYPAQNDENSLRVGLGYLQIASANAPNGELRGQIQFPSDPLCPADRNDDGFVTGDDYDEYVNEFKAGDINADFDFDGFVTGDDFDAFTAAFERGC